MDIAKKETEEKEFQATCERCGKVTYAHEPINIMMCIGSLGKKELLGHHMQCPQTEHWACSLDCLEIVAIKCIQEHIIPFLRKTHKEIENNVNNVHPL